MTYALNSALPRRQVTTFAKIVLSILSGTDESDGSKTTTTQTLYLCSRGIGWFNTPTLDETGGASQVFWHGLIAEPLEIRRSIPDGFTGFVPVEISPLILNLDGSTFEPYLTRISWRNSTVEIWECVGNIETTNISKVFTGRLDDARWTDSQLTISLADNANRFDRQARTIAFDKDLGHDPAVHGQAVPIVFGQIGWVRGVVLDYKADSPTTSDNRYWGFCDATCLNTVAMTVASVSGNTFQPSIASQRRLVGGNSSDNGSQIDLWTRTTGGASSGAVNQSTTSGIDVGTGLTVGNVITFCPIQRFVLYKKDGTDLVGYTRPLNVTSKDGIYCVELPTTFESDFGISGTLNPDEWYCVGLLRGPYSNVTIDGNFLDPDENHNGNFTAAHALVWLLKTYADFGESEFNLASFQDAVAKRGSEVVALIEPHDTTEPAVNIRDAVGRLLAKLSAVAFFDGDGKLKLKARAEFGTADYTATDADIIGQPEFDVFNSDVASIVNTKSTPHLYSYINARSEPLTTDIVSPSLGDLDRGYSEQAEKVLFNTADTAVDWAVGRRLVELSMYEVGCHSADGEENEGTERAGDFYIFPRLTVKLTLGAGFLDIEPGDVLELERERLPGFAYVAGTMRTKKFFVTSVTRADGFVTVEGDDQAGIEWYKNEAHWSPKANT